MPSGDVDLKKPSRLEYIVAGYCIGFFFMGLGLGMAFGGLDWGNYVFIIGVVIDGVLALHSKTNVRALRKYQLAEPQ